MDLFMILQLLCGLALFLFGMNSMGDGLESLSGGKLEKTLEKMTNSTMKGFILGAAVTAVIQSSSATTVMVVGFVNSGIMKLRQAIGIIMGANVGTTITSWILSLSGIEGDSLVMQLLKPSSFSAVFAFVGIILLMFCNSEKKKHLGTIFLGFGILMVGMAQMSAAVEPLSDDPTFTGFLTLFNNPVFGILAGAVHGHHPVLLRLCRYFAGIVQNRRNQLFNGNPDCYGTEYRHLRNRTYFLYRCKEKRKACRICTSLLQYYRHTRNLCIVLRF